MVIGQADQEYSAEQLQMYDGGNEKYGRGMLHNDLADQ
jgi:hypothetical protein